MAYERKGNTLLQRKKGTTSYVLRDIFLKSRRVLSQVLAEYLEASSCRSPLSVRQTVLSGCSLVSARCVVTQTFAEISG